MPKQLVKDLASSGYVPDATSASTPANAWSFVRNWEFTDEGYARVVSGYENALSLKATTSLSKNGTFIYPWTTLSDELSVFYISDDC